MTEQKKKLNIYTNLNLSDDIEGYIKIILKKEAERNSKFHLYSKIEYNFINYHDDVIN